MARSVRLAAVLVVCLAMSLPLMAQVYRVPETDARPAASKAPADGMLVAVDPVTGELRQPTPAEAATLTMMHRATQTSARALRMTRTAVGTVVELDDSFLDYFTVRLGEGGQLHAACVKPDAIESVMRLPLQPVAKLEEK